MSTNTQRPVMEPEPIVLYNNPLLFCAEGDMRNECAFVLKTIPLFETNFYQMSSGCEADVPYHYQASPSNSGNKIQMMRIVCKNVPKDQPEFVDVNNLTSFEHVVSDDENDVIFVKEYKEEVEEGGSVYEEKDETRDEGLRRNPVRKARINKGRGHLQKEHLLEEDFDFLDQFDEDNLVFCKNRPSPSANSTETCARESRKEWPINVFERPEYNPQTNKIEPFDYTIRDIQTKQLRKKPRLETCPKPKKKPKKKYIIRKRRPKALKVVEKVPITELKDVVASTFEMIGDFLKITNCDNNGMHDLLKNQTTLLAVVNDYGEREVSDCVSKLLSKS